MKTTVTNFVGTVLVATVLAHGSARAQESAGSSTSGFHPDAEQEGKGKAQDIRPQDVVMWEPFEAVELEGGKITVSVRMTLKEAWKVYASNLSFGGPTGFTVESITPPPAHKFMDPIENKEVDVYDGGEFAVTLQGTGRWEGATFPFTAKYVGCTNVICLFPFVQALDVAFKPLPAAAATTAVAATPAPAQDSLEAQLAAKVAAGEVAFGMLLALVFLGGILSNLTPCVYPMIPITLRLLARQGNSPYKNASFYALGIVATYSTLGLVAALSGGLFGSLLASKAFSITFAVIMLALGLSMLGFGDFSKIQMLGSKLGSGKPSAKNTFLMGAGAGFVAAPCTGPILAALLAYTAKNSSGIAASTTLLATYSLGFALPYVLLGGAATKISAVKVPHHVQVAVKLVFASVMFALGLYYLRIPLYSIVEQVKAFWQPITIAGLSIGLVLAAIWVIVPALQMSKATMILPAAILGTGIFAGSQWATSTPDQSKLVHFHSEAEALAAAATAKKPVLLDMWAEWCEACKKMDATTFVDPTVVAALRSGWITAKLDLTEDNDKNSEIQTRYGLQGLPTLVMLPPTGELAKKELITSYVSAATLLEQLKQFRLRQAE